MIRVSTTQLKKRACEETAAMRDRLSEAASENPDALHACVAGLRHALNGDITSEDGLDILAQHAVTRELCEILFTAKGPAWGVLEGALSELCPGARTPDSLRAFYDKTRKERAAMTEEEKREQATVLWETFFQSVDTLRAERQGIVYTPSEVTEYILKSVDHILRERFGRGIGDTGVDIIDPFTGTGTFISELLASGLIPDENLAHKYEHEIHANELAPGSAVVASMGIASAYKDRTGEDAGFPGLRVADTFAEYGSAGKQG